jgi:hypothetical protein
MVDFLCFLAALILLVMAAFGVPAQSRVTFGWLGLAFFVLAFFIHATQSLGLH